MRGFWKFPTPGQFVRMVTWFWQWDMFVRCSSSLTGAMHPGGTCPLIFPDYTAPGDERKEKKSKQKKKNGKTNHETPMEQKTKKREREKTIERRGLKGNGIKIGQGC